MFNNTREHDARRGKTTVLDSTDGGGQHTIKKVGQTGKLRRISEACSAMRDFFASKFEERFSRIESEVVEANESGQSKGGRTPKWCS